MKIKFLLLLSFFVFANANALNRTSKVNDKDVFGTRSFVENKGQFNPTVSFSDKIYYAMEHGDERIYFIGNGLAYKLTKHFPISEKQMEEFERGGHPYLKPDEVYYVKMNWVNCNPNIQIEESERQSHYFTNCIGKRIYYIFYSGIYAPIEQSAFATRSIFLFSIKFFVNQIY